MIKYFIHKNVTPLASPKNINFGPRHETLNFHELFCASPAFSKINYI